MSRNYVLNFMDNNALPGLSIKDVMLGNLKTVISKNFSIH